MGRIAMIEEQAILTRRGMDMNCTIKQKNIGY